MVFQLQGIPHTIHTYVASLFAKKMQGSLRFSYFLILGIYNEMMGVLYVLWVKIRKLKFHTALNT